jgi:putative transposase
MIAFIDDHRALYGVEPICKVLPIAPSTYHARMAQRVDPDKASVRARRDAELRTRIRQMFEANFAVYACARSGASSAVRASLPPAAPWRA